MSTPKQLKRSDQWYEGQAEIEFGGQEAQVEFRYRPKESDDDIYFAEEIHFDKCKLKLGLASAAGLQIHLIDVTDWCVEISENFWEQVQDQLDAVSFEYVPIPGNEYVLETD